MPNAASPACPSELVAGNRSNAPSEHQQTRRPERERRGGGHDAARCRQRGFERHDDEPDRRERGDAPRRHRYDRDQSGQRQRRQHVRAFVTAGARQKIRRQYRRHQPGEHHQLDRSRSAAREQINRKRRQRGNAAQQAWRNEGAMARRRQRVLLRRRMHQRLDIIPHRRDEAHCPDGTSGMADALPLFCCAIVSDGT